MVLLSIADGFIKRPVLTIVCSVLILLVGGICIPALPINYVPEIAPTQIEVTSTYIGADAETVENTVTNILEREINGVEGMQYITSTSSNEGVSSIQVTFDASRNKDQAQVDVQNRVAIAEPRLPETVRQVGVNTQSASSSILLAYGFYAENEEYDSVFLSNYIDSFVRDPLQRVDGVARIQIFGERKYAMRIWLDPNALASRGLSADDVADALREQNIQVGLGAIGQPPNPDDQAYTFTVRARSRLVDISEFENLVLKTEENGTLVKLKDVGRAELGAETYTGSASVQGLPGVGLGVFQLPGSNALAVAEGVKAEMAELVKSFPPGMKEILVYDTTEFVEASLEEVFISLLMAVALVILIIFIFLQDWRTTVIPAIAIPVALIGAMVFIFVFGFSINTLTLFGLILASGVVVDDAIVIVEAITAKIEQGLSPLQASFDAMEELTNATIATSLVLMAVFVPVAFFPGSTGKIYQQFALTIAFSILLSTFNALSFTPSISAILLRPQAESRGWLGQFFEWFNRVLDWFTGHYTRFVQFLIRIRMIVLGLFLLGIAATFWIYQLVPSSFVPDEDQGIFLGIIQAPDGVSINYTDRVIAEVEEILQSQPEVQSTFMISGFSFDGGGTNKGLFFTDLKPWSERSGADQSVNAVLQRLNGQFQGIQEAIVVAFNLPAIPGLANFGGFEFQVQDQSGGQLSIDDLAAAAYGISGAANQNPALAGSVFTQFTTGAPQLEVEVDRDRAKALNVNIDELLNTLGTYIGSQYVNDFTLGQRNYRVYIQADQQFRATPENISQIYVASSTDQMIPVSELVTIKPVTGPQIISHFNLFRSVKLQGGAAPGFSSGQAIQAMEDAFNQSTQPGIGRDWMGTAREELSSGGQAPLIFSLGLIVVFLVLAAQYENFVDPVIIMLTVPLAILGALLFVMTRQLSNDVYCQVALVMLIGLASKNAILIVEFANQARQEGLTIAQSAIKAAQERLRPILMTAISSLAGFFPLVIASGPGAASRWSIGTAVFGGMLAATFLSLLVVPVLYVTIKNLTEFILPKKPPHPPNDPPSATSESETVTSSEGSLQRPIPRMES
jgi:HAE1 family hydrophobic/amphiphilic exporter-1